MSDPTIVVIVAVLASLAGVALLVVSAWHFARLSSLLSGRRPARREDPPQDPRS